MSLSESEVPNLAPSIAFRSRLGAEYLHTKARRPRPSALHIELQVRCAAWRVSLSDKGQRVGRVFADVLRVVYVHGSACVSACCELSGSIDSPPSAGHSLAARVRVCVCVCVCVCRVCRVCVVCVVCVSCVCACASATGWHRGAFVGTRTCVGLVGGITKAIAGIAHCESASVRLLFAAHGRFKRSGLNFASQACQATTSYRTT